MISPNLKLTIFLVSGAVIGAGSTYGILRVQHSRTQAYLNIYTTSWDTYFTTQTISELRQGNLDKAESLLQLRLNAQIQSIGMAIEYNDRHKPEYLQTLEAIKEHREKYPYKSKNSRLDSEVEKVFTSSNQLKK